MYVCVCMYPRKAISAIVPKPWALKQVVQFEDILCQMTDMVKPDREGLITMMDLKHCRQPVSSSSSLIFY